MIDMEESVSHKIWCRSMIALDMFKIIINFDCSTCIAHLHV